MGALGNQRWLWLVNVRGWSILGLIRVWPILFITGRVLAQRKLLQLQVLRFFGGWLPKLLVQFENL